jgi:hypothetical protein
MLAVPADGLGIEDKAATTGALLRAGIDIGDINTVRRHLSGIKGGQLAARAGRSITLAISDVCTPVEDDPAVIGSGPTAGDQTTFADALAVIERAGIVEQVPHVAIHHLKEGAAGRRSGPVAPDDPRLHAAAYWMTPGAPLRNLQAPRRVPWNRGRSVRGNEDRAARVQVLRDDLRYAFDACMIEIRERFIEYPQRRRREHDARHREPAPLPGRQGPGGLLARFRQCHARQRGINAGCRELASQARLIGKVFKAAELGLESVAVAEVTERGTEGLTIRTDRLAPPAHFALFRAEQTRKDAQQSRLA